MFRKKAYQNVNEDQRHREEKEQLTLHFHRSLKCLQQKEHVDGATIVSNEASNNLCSVLEAVFLHGVKDRVVYKLVSYAQGSTEIKTNFWNVVKKFTHKDVITQLTELTQIKSDIGLCRAWVRLAVNDGLMASYLASMTADNKALTTFYHSWAYLLDYEQPEILRNHLTGLMGLNFNLSTNSNILNKWSSTTVSFAGLMVEALAPPPVVRSATPTPPTSRRGSQNSVASMDSISGLNSHNNTSSISTITITTTTTASSLTVPSHTAHVYHTSTPPNTPANAELFNNPHDMEALRRLADAVRSSSVSSGSSSQASCPDPSELHSVDGHLSARSSRSTSPFDKPPSRNSPHGSMVFMTREYRKLDEEMKLNSILDRIDKKEQEREDREILLENERKQKELYAAMERERLEKKEREKREVEEAEEQFRRWQREKEESLAQKEQQEPRKQPCTTDELSRGITATKQESQHLEALISTSDNLVDSIEDAMTTIAGSREDLPPVQRVRAGGETDRRIQPASSYGNSLNARDGWTTGSSCQDFKGLEQSYETMLKGYHVHEASNSRIATVDDVLDGMPGAQQTKDRASKERIAEPFAAVDVSDDDIDFADYEIIHSASQDSDAAKVEHMKSLCNYLGKNAQSNVCATPNCNIGVGFFHGPGIICELDGQTYCDQCHLSQYAYIPAEIIFNWNFKRRKVCAENYKFLQRVQDQPVLAVDEISEGIYSTVSAMNTVLRLRTRLTSLRSYMFTCSESTARQLKDRVWPREHLYNEIHTYSVNDLLEVKSGKLETFLKEVVDLCTKHVYSCSLCLGKGFYCELCQESTPIFPFEIGTTVKCKSCRNVYHSRCKTDAIPCPKCLRYTQRGIRRQADNDDDYACSPV